MSHTWVLTLSNRLIYKDQALTTGKGYSMTYAHTSEFHGYIIKRESDGRTLRHVTGADCPSIAKIAHDVAQVEGQAVYVLENFTYQSKYAGE